MKTYEMFLYENTFQSETFSAEGEEKLVIHKRLDMKIILTAVAQKGKRRSSGFGLSISSDYNSRPTSNLSINSNEQNQIG